MVLLIDVTVWVTLLLKNDLCKLDGVFLRKQFQLNENLIWLNLLNRETIFLSCY